MLLFIVNYGWFVVRYKSEVGALDVQTFEYYLTLEISSFTSKPLVYCNQFTEWEYIQLLDVLKGGDE